jgi:hypothetical protein
MLPPFDLSVPSDDRYRSLTPEVTAKYAELAGRPAADAQALATEVNEAATRLAKPDQNIDIKLTSTEDRVNVSLESAGQTATLTSR